MICNAFFFNLHSFSTHFHSFCSPQVYFYNDFFHNSSFCLFLSSKEIRYHFVLIPTVSFCYFHSMLLLLLYHSLNDSDFKHITPKKSCIFARIKIYQSKMWTRNQSNTIITIFIFSLIRFFIYNLKRPNKQ